MRIHTISDLRDGPLRDLICASARGRRLVPVLGAGFSCGLPALKGTVPDSDLLKDQLVSILLESGIIEEDEGDELRAEEFSEVVMSFFDFVFPYGKGEGEAKGSARARELFERYIEDNFTSVSGLSQHQQEFLRCGWPYLYTLNFDDAIEPVLGSEYTVIHPYADIDREWYGQGHKSLIKLHGDAGEMLRSHSAQPRIILDVRQYLRSITDDANDELLQWLIDDCASKDLLFIGCSLDSEQDLLFAQHVGVSELSGTSSQNSLYVYYDEQPEGELPHSIRRKLRRYGIKNVLRLSPEEYDEFYEIVASICGEQMSSVVEEELDNHTGFSFHRLPPAETSADHILYEPELITYGEGESPQVVLPSFYVERSVAREVVEALKGNESVCTILGRRFSGMTYALLGVVDLLQREGRKVYFFTQMRLADEAVDRLAEKEDCVLVFDAYTAETRQASKLLDLGAEGLKARRLQLVFGVDQSEVVARGGAGQRGAGEGAGQRGAGERAGQRGTQLELIRGFQLESTLNSEELAEFNAKMGELLPVERGAGETFLDYALKVDAAALAEDGGARVDEGLPTPAGGDMLAAIVALAMQPSMRVDTANRLGIADELTALSQKLGPVVQMDYLSPLEVGPSDHSGTKYVSNSRLWLAKYLRNLAASPEGDRDIAEAVKSIAARQKVAALPPADGALGEVEEGSEQRGALGALNEILG